MKKLIIALFSVFCLSTSAFAQDNFIKLNISQNFNTPYNYGLSYEAFINERSSVELGLNYSFIRINQFDEDGHGFSVKGNGIGIMQDFKYHFVKRKVHSFYAAPYFGLKFYAIDEMLKDVELGVLTEEDNNGNISAFIMGAKLGYKCILWEHLLLEVNVGFEANYYSYDVLFTEYAGFSEDDSKGIMPNFRETLKIGYKF